MKKRKTITPTVVDEPLPQFQHASKEVLAMLVNHGYEYQYVTQGLYRINKVNALTKDYLNADEIDGLLQKLDKSQQISVKRRATKDRKEAEACASPVCELVKVAKKKRGGKSKVDKETQKTPKRRRAR